MLLSGRIVPFIGAGVSIQCVTPGDETFQPTVKWMREQLCHLFDLDRYDVNSLTEAAERVHWHHSFSDILDAIRIDSFHRLRPAKSHRYLARLVREGWIREVITTNWDCCIERAWTSTFRHARNRNDGPHIVVDNETRADRAQPGSQDRLTVFKINGCAKASKRNYRQILITDKQLSTIDQAWKADIIRDRMRSSTILFSGFGGEEAQVRQLVHQITSELPLSSVKIEGLVDCRYDPRVVGRFVHVYEEFPSFYHQQILGGSCEYNDSFVSGRDCHELSLDGAKLKADDLWRLLYVAAISHSIRQALRDINSAIRVWLHGVGLGRSGGVLVDRVIRALPDPFEPSKSSSSNLAGRFRDLWEDPEWDTDVLDCTLPWQRALHIARFGYPPRRPAHVDYEYPWEYYHPHREQGGADGALALLLSHPFCNVDPRVIREGLVPLKGDSGRDRHAVLLWAEGAQDPVRELCTPADIEINPIIAITFPDRRTRGRDRTLRVRIRKVISSNSQNTEQVSANTTHASEHSVGRTSVQTIQVLELRCIGLSTILRSPSTVDHSVSAEGRNRCGHQILYEISHAAIELDDTRRWPPGLSLVDVSNKNRTKTSPTRVITNGSKSKLTSGSLDT